jgi:hypothetical protein
VECDCEIIHTARVLGRNCSRLNCHFCLDLEPFGGRLRAATAIASGYGSAFPLNSICDITIARSDREDAMNAFITACLATIVIAVIGLVVLNHVQEPADEAFSTSYARAG